MAGVDAPVKPAPVSEGVKEVVSKKLLSDGQVEAMGLISKAGKPYDAVVSLDCADDGNARVRLVFNN